MKILLSILDISFDVIWGKLCYIVGDILLVFGIYFIARISLNIRTRQPSLWRSIKMYIGWVFLIVILCFMKGYASIFNTDWNNFIPHFIVYYLIAVIGITEAINRDKALRGFERLDKIEEDKKRNKNNPYYRNRD